MNNYKVNMKKSSEDAINILFTILDACIVSVFALFLGFLYDAWVYHPVLSGGDTYAHVSMIKFVMNNWPHCRWNHLWSGGMLYLRKHPFLFLFLIAPFAKLSSIEVSWTVYAAVSMCLIGLGYYALTRELTKKRRISLMISLLVVSSPQLWFWYLFHGFLHRFMAIVLVPFSLYFAVRYAKSLVGERLSVKTYIGLVLSLAVSVSFHPFIGLPSLFCVLLICLYRAKDWRRRIGSILQVSVPTMLLNTYLILPWIRSPPFAIPPTRYDWGMKDILLLFHLPKAGWDEGLSPIFLPLTAVLLLSAYRLSVPIRKDKVLLALGTMSLLVLCYPWLGFIAPSIYGSMPHPAMAALLLPLFLLPLCGILLNRVFARIHRHQKAILNLLLCSFIVLILLVSQVNPIAKIRHGPGVRHNYFGNLFGQLEINCSETMFRAGVSGKQSWLGQWFNNLYPVPQTRDYFAQGVIYPNWVSWFMGGVYLPSENYEETNFLLDWWAVKWIIAEEGVDNPEKFSGKPEHYKFVTETSPQAFFEFIYSEATPIYSATNAPSLLIISEHAPPGGGSYRGIVNDLAYSNYNSRYAVPIHGGEYIDDYSLEELKKFDAVVLYGYKYHNRDKAWELLREYVWGGGGLIIETGYSPDADASFIPEPSPVNRTIWTNFGEYWHFTNASSPVTNGINFTAFSPAVSEGAAWGVSSSLNESVRKDWAETVLWDSGYPLVVMGRYGKGRVIWSGMNLPWHIEVYKNPVESLFLTKMTDWASKASEKRDLQVDYIAERVNPEKVVVEVYNAVGGVLFKENYVKDWHAFLEKDGRRIEELKVYKAGPDFMYVVVPKDVEYPATIVFEFTKLIEHIGFSISAATLLILLIYGVVGEKIILPFARARGKIKEKIEGWWYKEE